MLQKQIKNSTDDCQQYQFLLEQEKEAYNKLMVETEEKLKKPGQASSMKQVNNVSELEERLEKAKEQNEELKNDFTKMIDDYEKNNKKELREFEKMKASCERFKSICEKKDIELKRLKSITKNSSDDRVLEDLKEKLVKSDGRVVELELKNEDLQNEMKSKIKQHDSELSNLNKKLHSLIRDNEELRNKLEETIKQLNLKQQENVKLKQNTSTLKNNLLSPLARSMSTLNVLSSENDENVSLTSLMNQPPKISRRISLPGEKPRGLKMSESPKRNIDDLDQVSSKSKRTRLNTIDETTSQKVNSTSRSAVGRRKSARISKKPYVRELPSSSSDEEVLQKQMKKNDESHPTKENPSPVPVFAEPKTLDKPKPLTMKTNVLPDNPVNQKQRMRELGKPVRASEKEAVSGPKRVTRSASTLHSSSNDGNAETRKPLRVPSVNSNEEEDKCKMQ